MFDELEEMIQSEMERIRIHGLAIALVAGREIVWSQGYGYADIENKVPVTPATVFSVQSVTKSVVATALMQWCDRGRFKLDDPVNDHLGPIRLRSQWDDRTPVTIRHLLTHTSGIPGTRDVVRPTDVVRLTEDGTLPTLEDYVAAVAKTVRPPGEEIVYTDIAYAVIGYLVGRFAGQPYDVYLRENVLEPLGMRSSAIAHAPHGTSVATGYFLSAIDGAHHPVLRSRLVSRPATPAGALLSTVDDLGRFLIAHLNGGVYQGRRLLKEETVVDMQRLHARAGRSHSGIGLGFMVHDVDGRRQISHGGGAPGWAALIAAYPEEKVGVVILTNMDGAFYTLPVIASTALGFLVGDFRQHDIPALKREPPPAEWRRVVGRYPLRGIDASLTIEDGLLILEVGGTKSYLEYMEDSLFRAHNGYFGGCEVAFDYGADGKAKRFYGGIDPFWFERQGDVVSTAELAVDEEADLVGRWRGTCASLLGPMPLTLRIVDVATATVTTLSVQDAAVEEFRAECGRVSGQFDMTVPGVGDFRIFLRLGAVGGKLRGEAYARSDIGEYPMPTELTLG